MPSLLRACVVGAVLVACAPEGDSGEPRFYVLDVEPADASVANVELAAVQLRFNEAPDLARCTATTVRVDAQRDDGTLAFPVAAELTLTGAAVLRLRPVEPYLHGWTYAVTVRGGDTGCASASGIPAEPFVSTFEVP